MSTTVAYTEADVCTFVEALGHLSDDRDNRGQRHALAFVVAAVVLAATAAPLGRHEEYEKGHGRLSTREGQCFDMRVVDLAARWSGSVVQTLVVTQRDTVTLSTQNMTSETADYISNQALSRDPQGQAMELTQAIREHWHVESDNWIRDVTLNEDHVKTQSSNQAHIMGSIRRLAMRLLRQFKVPNFQAALEDLADCPSRFETWLRRANFL